MKIVSNKEIYFIFTLKVRICCSGCSEGHPESVVPDVPKGIRNYR